MAQIRTLNPPRPGTSATLMEASGTLALDELETFGRSILAALKASPKGRSCILDLSKLVPGPAGNWEHALKAELVRRVAQSSDHDLWITGLSSDRGWNHGASAGDLLKLLESPELADSHFSDWLERRIADCDAQADALEKSLPPPDLSARRSQAIEARRLRQAEAKLALRMQAQAPVQETGILPHSLSRLEEKILAALAAQGIGPKESSR